MEYFTSNEEEDDYYSSDQEAVPLDGLENEEPDAQWVPSKAPSCKSSWVTAAELILVASSEYGGSRKQARQEWSEPVSDFT
ncbi:hypothetical protein CASFOL_042217 [Castilleja foliolosa]|uniref:Uncharacterized protein n=1 Tax=Castilleja foliolosa TaxID=1961234 RepID=A0ABD3B9V5_9LAMI